MVSSGFSMVVSWCLVARTDHLASPLRGGALHRIRRVSKVDLPRDEAGERLPLPRAGTASVGPSSRRAGGGSRARVSRTRARSPRNRRVSGYSLTCRWYRVNASRKAPFASSKRCRSWRTSPRLCGSPPDPQVGPARVATRPRAAPGGRVHFGSSPRPDRPGLRPGGAAEPQLDLGQDVAVDLSDAIACDQGLQDRPRLFQALAGLARPPEERRHSPGCPGRSTGSTDGGNRRKSSESFRLSSSALR